MKFSNKIINWYIQNKRDLPWRKTSDAYTIWLSEMILQQTRIDQGLEYFNRFIDQYPDVDRLAEASETEILKLWQGLGYYSRARNLLKTARIIVEKYNGRFPDSFEELLNLSGVGPYTAAAILSMAFNQPFPVVDGNVFRVISRIYGIDEPVDKSSGRKKTEAMVLKLIDKNRPGDFNQAIMEFGALFCLPKKPNCVNCIFNKDCVAYKKGMVGQWPIKAGKIAIRVRYFEYLVFTSRKVKGNYIFINHRKDSDIWKGLYDFPYFEFENKISFDQLTNHLQNKFYVKPKKHYCIEANIKHILTHQTIIASFHLIKLDNNDKKTEDALLLAGYKIWSIELIGKLPVPRLIEQFLDRNHGKF